MRLESNGLKRVLILLFSLLPASLVLLSCGATPSGSTQTSGIKYRAFISNSVSAGSSIAGLYIVNAQTDVRPILAPMSAGNTPGMMVVTPNRGQTLVFSGSGTQGTDNQFTFINNAAETPSGHLTLPGMTESFVVSPDSSAAYIAMPTAAVIGQSPGVVKAVSLGTGSYTGEVDIPSIHYLSMNNSGNRILGFSDNSDYVSVITPSQIGIGNAVTLIGGPGIFDQPVAAFFSSDDNTAWVLSCGAECGGTQASVQEYSFQSNSIVASVALCTTDASNHLQCAGSVAYVNGSTMYVAGTPYATGGSPSLSCPSSPATLAVNCGQLAIVNLSSMTVTNAVPIFITDGYHNRIALGANGQLFIGSRTCTEIVPPIPPPQGAETRGCLSVYNTQTGAVVIPPANGDVTGIQPIATRTVVYVVQGGSLGIYDTATDKLQTLQIINIVGQFIDVKTVDF
jgi:hypothetical protein